MASGSPEQETGCTVTEKSIIEILGKNEGKVVAGGAGNSGLGCEEQIVEKHAEESLRD